MVRYGQIIGFVPSWEREKGLSEIRCHAISKTRLCQRYGWNVITFTCNCGASA